MLETAASGVAVCDAAVPSLKRSLSVAQLLPR